MTSNSDLSIHIETLRQKMHTQSKLLHDQLWSVECQVSAEKDGLMQHIDDVAAKINSARMEIVSRVMQLASPYESQGLPPIEERFSSPRIARNVNEAFDGLYYGAVN